jgi:hypothetical protein
MELGWQDGGAIEKFMNRNTRVFRVEENFYSIKNERNVPFNLF